MSEPPRVGGIPHRCKGGRLIVTFGEHERVFCPPCLGSARNRPAGGSSDPATSLSRSTGLAPQPARLPASPKVTMSQDVVTSFVTSDDHNLELKATLSIRPSSLPRRPSQERVTLTFFGEDHVDVTALNILQIKPGSWALLVMVLQLNVLS
jgi:hypothetical protein